MELFCDLLCCLLFFLCCDLFCCMICFVFVLPFASMTFPSWELTNVLMRDSLGQGYCVPLKSLYFLRHLLPPSVKSRKLPYSDTCSFRNLHGKKYMMWSDKSVAGHWNASFITHVWPVLLSGCALRTWQYPIQTRERSENGQASSRDAGRQDVEVTQASCSLSSRCGATDGEWDADTGAAGECVWGGGGEWQTESSSLPLACS